MESNEMPHAVGKVYEVFVGMLMTFIILQAVLIQILVLGFLIDVSVEEC
jgi:hypothetical protein